MKYKIDYISTFYADVVQVDNYLAEHPRKAARLFSRLDKILGSLVNMPEMYPLYEDFPAFRKITIEDYLVFYTIEKHNSVIEVHRLINARMDVPKRLV